MFDHLFHDIIWADEPQASPPPPPPPSPSAPAPPRFGGRGSEWVDVERFYSYWSSYSTQKSFHWADAYNPNSAPSRKVLGLFFDYFRGILSFISFFSSTTSCALKIKRMMEQANKKERDKYRKEWNEEVRHLVSFIKKRGISLSDEVIRF